jgi:gluconolactonase
MHDSAVTGLVIGVLVTMVAGCATKAPEAGQAIEPGEIVVVDSVGGPEGPLVVDGDLYYVGWVSNALFKWDGKTSTVLNEAPGCSHNGLALTPQKTFLLACTSDPGAILELDLAGKELRRWESDREGRKFIGGINDIAVTAAGGAYATVFGPFQERPTTIVGKVLYLAPGANDWVEVADDLNYANGIAVSPDQHTLYVNETAGNAIVRFTINPDGTLRDRSNFALLYVLADGAPPSWWLGPDSMKLDREGNLYVAQWSGGRILKLSPEGKLLHVFPVAAGRGTTNVALSADESELYVSVVRDPEDPRAVGSIVKVANVR